MGAPDPVIARARKLRREMSPAEAILWQQLRQRPAGFKFRRQFPLDPYSLDFACLESRLAIEVDGEAHERGDRPARDALRDRILLEKGFDTMRVPAAEVFRNLEGVLAGIVEQCRRFRPLHQASRNGCCAAGFGSRHAPSMPTRLHPPRRSGEEQE